MSYIEIVQPSFGALVIPDSSLELLYTGARWAEGPVYFGAGLVFSDIPNDRMLRWDEASGHVAAFRSPSNFANGNTRDRAGRLVTCEHGSRSVTRTEPDGRITILADRFAGKRLNSPNDVVVAADGAIWFTDPSYGILSDYEGHKADSEIGRCDVYRLDMASGEVRVAATDFDKPNGLAFSADGLTLYVADSGRSHDPDGPHHVRAFDVSDDGRLSNDRVFAVISPGNPDGLRIDEEERVWISAADGVHCYDKGGELLGKIRVGELVANLCFGGPRRDRLFITASTSLYAVSVNTRGAQSP